VVDGARIARLEDDADVVPEAVPDEVVVDAAGREQRGNRDRVRAQKLAASRSNRSSSPVSGGASIAFRSCLFTSRSVRMVIHSWPTQK